MIVVREPTTDFLPHFYQKINKMRPIHKTTQIKSLVLYSRIITYLIVGIEFDVT